MIRHAHQPARSTATTPFVSDSFRARLEDALGRSYELGRELGGGGMSRVFVATERSLGRTVVVKVLPPELAAGVNRERFRREIQLAARLQHPHIVPLLAAGEHADMLYYTMPFIEGESLRALAASRGRLTVREVVRILHDVAEALAYAHVRGVIHRDIKPGNILMLGSHALVTDFGVAKALSAARPPSGTTSAGMAVGTPAYMAPEQLAADPAADHRVDIYALGLVAYELLSGTSPFAAPSPRETLAAQLTRVPDPIELFRADVPPALSSLVMRCLEKSPDHRPPDGDALLAELEAAVAGGGTSGASFGASSGAGFAFDDPVTPRAGTPGPGSGPAGGGAASLTPTGAATPDHAPGPFPHPGERPAVGAWARRRTWLGVAALALVAFALGGVFALSGTWPGRARAASTAAAPTLADVVIPADTARAQAVSPTVPPPPAPAPAAPPPAVPRPLTREDSLAIAAAVRERLEPARPVGVTGRTRDSMMALLERTIADSVAHAIRESRRWTFETGQPRTGQVVVPLPPGARVDVVPEPRFRVHAFGPRIVVLGTVENATGSRAMTGAAEALTAALHGAVSAEGAFEVRRSDGPIGANRRAYELADSLGAGAIVRPLLVARGDSAVSLLLMVLDGRRRLPVATLESRAPAGDPAAALDPRLLAELRSMLGGVAWHAPAVRRP